MPTYFKCPACGEQHRSGFQFGSKRALDAVVMSGCKDWCPETRQMVPIEKKDLTFMQRVHFLVVPDDGGYSALCYEFNVAACGDSPEEAEENLAGAVSDYLQHLADEARLDDAIRPASNELLMEFLELGVGSARSEALAEVMGRAFMDSALAGAAGRQQAGPAPQDGVLDSVRGNRYEFRPPVAAMKNRGVYAVRVAVHGG